MTATKNLLDLAVALQAAALVGENIKHSLKPNKKKGLVGLGVKNIVGIELLKTQSQLVGNL